MSNLSIRGKHFLWLGEFTSEELELILKKAKELKLRYYAGEKIIPILKGKTLVMIFQKPSTRTRISFEVAMKQLGGFTISLNWYEMQLRRGETVADTARTLSRYADGIVARVYNHKDLEEMAKHSNVPVINGLSDLFHPVQAISDMFTILEKKGRLQGLKLVFLGDGGNNVAQSLLIASTKLGLNITIASPVKYRPRQEVIKIAEEAAQESGAEIVFEEDPEKAVENADIIYTDVWVSMGQEKEAKGRVKDLSKYQVNVSLVKKAKKDVIFMHCLPAHRGQEVTDEVIDGPWSIVWDQAENRLHVQKAILSLLL
ncbi:MAG: ornithine carbamoyltransferase [Thermoprotei archaeon]|nr:MAG: ornithine carbamoyltransferase [Thermoprotei archaeon]